MLSDISKMVVDAESFVLKKKDGNEIEFYGNIEELFDKGQTVVKMVYENGDALECDAVCCDSQLTVAEKTQFVPWEMSRLILKDIRKGREFDLDYRKHLVYDFNRNHYNMVVVDEVDETKLETAKKIIRTWSMGKSNKPTGVVTKNKVVIVRGNDNFTVNIP